MVCPKAAQRLVHKLIINIPLLLMIINSWTRTHSHAASCASHGLNIDAHQRAELQLWLVHKRFGRAYLAYVRTACVRSCRDWLRTSANDHCTALLLRT